MGRRGVSPRGGCCFDDDNTSRSVDQYMLHRRGGQLSAPRHLTGLSIMDKGIDIRLLTGRSLSIVLERGVV